MRTRPLDASRVNIEGREAMPNRQHLLVSLAMVRTNWDSGRSHLDSFVPFVASSLLHIDSVPSTLQQVQTAVADEYSLQLPLGVVRQALKRLASRGYLQLERGVYWPDAQRLVEFDVEKARETARREQGALVRRLRDYASSTYGRDISDEEAWEALDAYVGDWTLAVARAMAPESEAQFELGLAAADNFIVTSFIAELIRTDPEGFRYLETAVKGSMVASALYHPEAGAISQHFDGLTVYLDGPLVLDGLGYSQEEECLAVRELLKLLYGLGANLACFERTVDEVRGVLSSARAQLMARRTSMLRAGAAYEFFVQHGYTPSDVELLLSHLEEDIAALPVRIDPFPPRVPKIQIDESALEVVMMQEVRYVHAPACQHDLDALSAIDRLRDGHHAKKLETCGAVFATKNTSLVRAAHKFFSLGGVLRCPPAVSHYDLATLAWLKNPAKAPDLPRRQIIADCYATLRPSDRLWARFIKEAERIERDGKITPEELTILRFEPDAERILSRKTLGDEFNVSEQTVHEVLDEARETIREPIRLDKEAALKKEHAQTLHVAKRAEAAEESRAAVIDALHADCRRRAAKRARLIVRGALGAPLYAFAVFVFICFVLSEVGVAPFSPAVVAWGAVGMAALVALAAVDWILGLGINVRLLLRRLEIALQTKLEKRFVDMLPIEARTSSDAIAPGRDAEAR